MQNVRPYLNNIVAAFRGMHVSPAKHSYAWISIKCDYRTDKRTEAGQSDPYAPLCFAGDTKIHSTSLSFGHVHKVMCPFWPWAVKLSSKEFPLFIMCSEFKEYTANRLVSIVYSQYFKWNKLKWMEKTFNDNFNFQK